MMGRIRSIHPGILTDPEFASISVEDRLLFIYSWIVADDAGNLERSPLGLKMACFPADDWATQARIGDLVEALIAGRFYEPYEANGKQYLHIRNFAKYQKPDHPTKPKFPLFPGQEFSYEVREGNTWIAKTVSSLSPDRSPNVPRTYPKRTGNVLAGEERSGIGEERKRSGLGEEGKGMGREGNAGAPPPSEGAGGAARKNGGNGKHNPSSKGSPDFRKAAVSQVIARVECRDWPAEKAIDHLVSVFGFSKEEAEAVFKGRCGNGQLVIEK